MSGERCNTGDVFFIFIGMRSLPFSSKTYINTHRKKDRLRGYLVILIKHVYKIENVNVVCYKNCSYSYFISSNIKQDNLTI